MKKLRLYLEKWAEWADVTIRCYLLGQVIGEVLDEMEESEDFWHVKSRKAGYKSNRGMAGRKMDNCEYGSQ